MGKKGLGMEVNVCIPTLNNYEGLNKCIESILNSKTYVNMIYVIDNGGGFESIWDGTVVVNRPGRNLGVAASWNKFIQKVPQVRLICNDDIVFEPDAIDVMVQNIELNRLVFPTGLDNVNAFSCFILPDEIIEVVGLFDEKISPNYGYFEDNDYHRRMLMGSCDIKPCPARVHHAGSVTLSKFNANDTRRHHDRFKLAEMNYIRKWGGIPGKETLTIPREL